MRKKNFTINSICVCNCFESGTPIREYFADKGISYDVFLKEWKNKIGIRISDVRKIYLYDNYLRHNKIACNEI